MGRLPAAARADADLLFVLTMKDLRVRYRGAAFGCLWALFLPLFYAAMYKISFGALGIGRAGGLGELLIGTAVLQWTAGAVGSAPKIFLRDSALLRRVPTRWTFHAAAEVLCQAAPFVAALPVVAVFLAAEGRRPSPLALFYGPLLGLAQAAALAGWAAAAAASNLVVRDVERLSVPLATALFFATPVAYSVSALPAWARPWLALNPAAVFVEAWRQALAGAVDGRLAFAACVHAAVGLAMMFFIERFAGRRLAEFL